MEVYAGCVTDRGNYREKNQDRAVCHVRQNGHSVLAAACVCDGIGSFAHSETAAEMVTKGITRWFEGVKDLFPEVMDADMLREDLEMTIRELNELVYAYRNEQDPQMGCTMSVMLLTNADYQLFHVGDSRICRVNGGLWPMTRDEVSMAEVNGRVKPLLANFIGKSDTLWVNKLSGTVEENDRFLLGSDGLFKKLTYEDVEEETGKIRSGRQAQKACERLLKRVMDRGEKDNISCILICAQSVTED